MGEVKFPFEMSNVKQLEILRRIQLKCQTWGQSYKANFGINYIKNGLNNLHFTLNYINFDEIYAKKVLYD